MFRSALSFIRFPNETNDEGAEMGEGGGFADGFGVSGPETGVLGFTVGE